MKNLLRNIAIFLTLICLASLQMLMAESRKHEVQPGQTLYSIARAYGVTVEAIQAANPSISGTNIPSGMVLVIPDATQEPVATPTVPLQDTQYNVNSGSRSSIDAIEKPFVPESANPAVTHAVQNPTLPVVAGEGHWTDGVLNMAVILPFHLEAGTASDNKTQMRSVEFYKGVLMAADAMQKKGRTVKLQTYDVATESLYNVLYRENLREADIVIAPMDEAEVRTVAEWGEKNGTPVVSPFGFNAEMIDRYEHLFQVNTAKSMLYPQLTAELLQRFRDYTFVFLTDSVGSRKADPYPVQLKQTLNQNGIAYSELSYLRPERLMACDSILGLKDRNILFVPVTPQPEAMRRMFSGLQHVKILRDARYAQALADGQAPAGGQPLLAVLGYPEWLLNMHEFVNYYYDLNVYLFSKVYANPFDPEVKQFYTDFKLWYGKEPMSIIPKYALLGYDVANYFFQSLTRNGQHLMDRIETQPEDGLQTVFCFDHGAGESFINRGFYLVHFTPESTIEKIVVQ